jgi:hypothetical protein
MFPSPSFSCFSAGASSNRPSSSTAPRGVDLPMPMPMLPMPMPRPASTWPAWLGHDYCSDYRCPPARALHTTTHVSMAAGLGIKVSTAFLFVRRAGNPIPYPLPASALPLLCACLLCASTVAPSPLPLARPRPFSPLLSPREPRRLPSPLHHHSTTTLSTTQPANYTLSPKLPSTHRMRGPSLSL